MPENTKQIPSTRSLAQLPLEVLSHVVSCLPPDFYPPLLTLHPTSQPSPFIIESLDPHSSPPQSSSQIISSVAKTSTQLLEAARPWLWENVDVRSGRGWLAIVDALTEEVVDDERIGSENRAVEGAFPGMNGTKTSEAADSDIALPPFTPISPDASSAPLPIMQQAHPQPNTVPAGFARYVSLPSTSTYHYPFTAPSTGLSTSSGIAVNLPTYSYSPPQPPRISLLLTPPGSRNSSPSSINRSPSVTSRLRPRSRSPRHNVGFDTEGISSVLDRSRSVSHHRGGISLERRRSSLSRSRVPQPDSSSEDEDEVREMSMSPTSQHDAILTPPSLESLPLFEEEVVTENVNPELLPSPGPYIRHLSFTNFKTIGSRRTQEEAVRGRFVTGGRLEGVIKNAPNLVSLCMTEYVDSALSYPVMEELFFRGYVQPRLPRRPFSPGSSTISSSGAHTPAIPLSIQDSSTANQLDPPRPVYVPYETETEEEKWKRRGMFSPLEALDLTGCVSGVFSAAIADFGEIWLGVGVTDDERGRGRSRRRTGEDMTSSTETEDDDTPKYSHRTGSRLRKRLPTFSSLHRLSLRACTSLSSQLIHSLVLSMPALTHLDLSATRVPSSLLVELTNNPPPTLHLQSLSLARCPRIDPTILVDFLSHSPATRDLIELNLYVDPTQSERILQSDLARLLSTAPCFQHGRLRYLDLSSADFTSSHLLPENFPAQPSLISLGLSHIPNLSLQAIATFLQGSAPNVEILTLTGTASAQNLKPSSTPLQITLELHARLINPLTTIPFSLKGLDLTGSTGIGGMRRIDCSPGPSRLRVIEFGSGIRRALGPNGGSPEWKVVRSKGGRGWYVDISAGWVKEETMKSFGGVLPVVEETDVSPPSPVSLDSPYSSGVDGKIDQKADDEGLVFVRHLPASHERRVYLAALASANGKVGSAVGWHSRKMEVIRGMGMMGREEGMGGAGAFAFEE